MCCVYPTNTEVANVDSIGQLREKQDHLTWVPLNETHYKCIYIFQISWIYSEILT